MKHNYVMQVTVQNHDGIHARPAMLTAEAASRFASDIINRKNGLKVNGKSVLDLLTLAAGYGAKLQIETRGNDADIALKTIAKILSSAFNYPMKEGQTKSYKNVSETQTHLNEHECGS